MQNSLHLNGSVGIFEVHLPLWSPPLLVAACGFQEALRAATRQSLYGRAVGGSSVVIDVSDQFQSLSARMRTHMDALGAFCTATIVEYDEVEGWRPATGVINHSL